MLLRIREFGLLTREQIQRLEFSPSTASACKRRLTLLYHNGYVGRLALPVRNAYGAARAVYFLEHLGERALVGTGLVEKTNERFRHPEAPGELFLQHRLDIADVRVAFTIASRIRGYVLVWWDEAILRRKAAFDVRGALDRHRLLPDGYFTLSDGLSIDGFAVEVDRATVPEERMRGRFLSYGELATSGAYRERLPADSFRVLTVVTVKNAPARLQRLKALCESVGGRSLFWFADRAGAGAADILSEDCWSVAGAQQRRSLALSLK